MTFIGLSLLVATFTFFLYKIPPSTWSLPWLRPPLGEPDAYPKSPYIDVNESKGDPAPAPAQVVDEPKKDVVSTNTDPKETKADLDRKAMPPPMLVNKPNTPALQLSAASSSSQAYSIASLKRLTEQTDPSERSAPSFPALNSAQRAGGSCGLHRLNPIPQVQPPLRPISLTSSSLRTPLPNRGGPPSLVPPPTHNSIPSKPRQKVQLTPGHSPLDWAKLSDAPNANLRGLPASTPYLKVPLSELRRYNGRKGKDAWTVLGGKVYNITPYLPYHPGGELELMKCAGRDGTKLFAEVHPWVNWEGMLGACLIGIAVGEAEISKTSALEDMD